MGVIKGDTRSLDNGSYGFCRVHVLKGASLNILESVMLGAYSGTCVKHSVGTAFLHASLTTLANRR